MTAEQAAEEINALEQERSIRALMDPGLRQKIIHDQFVESVREKKIAKQQLSNLIAKMIEENPQILKDANRIARNLCSRSLLRRPGMDAASHFSDNSNRPRQINGRNRKARRALAKKRRAR